VTLTRADVDAQGFPTRAAEGRVWAAVAALPEGATVVLDLGPARHVSRRLLSLCREHLGAGSELIIEGRDPDVVGAYLAAARGGAR
jgi:predicted kinase